MEREAVAHCANCINLLYLNGVPKCAEYNFLLSPADILNSIECTKYLPLNSITSFKRHTGTSGKTQVTEEVVLETIVSLAVKQRRSITVSEIQKQLPLNRAALFPILQRLVSGNQLRVTTMIVTYPDAPKRKTWRVNAYFPLLLEGRVETQDSEEHCLIERVG